MMMRRERDVEITGDYELKDEIDELRREKVNHWLFLSFSLFLFLDSSIVC